MPCRLSPEVAPDPPGDLALMRQALELARRQGQPFAETWDAVIAHLVEAPTTRGADARDRAITIDALERTRLDWQRAWERKPSPPIPQPRLPGGPPLTAREAERLLKDDRPKIVKKRGPGRPRKHSPVAA